MPNVANLANQSNAKILMKKQRKDHTRYNCIYKTNCPLKGKYQLENVVQNLQVYCYHIAIKNNKKVYFGSS